MKKQGTQIPSGSDDVPIPSAHTRGRITRLDFIKEIITNNQINFSSLRNTYTQKATVLMLFTVLLIPSFLSNAEPAIAISYPETIIVADKTLDIPPHWDPTLVAIVENEIDRHGIENDMWPQRLDAYINMIKHIESDNKRTAYNPSGAMSYFQFKSESIKTAHYRLINYMRRHEIGEIPTWSKNLYYRPNRIYNTNSNKQAVLVVVNMIELDREIGTSYFKHFLDGDNQAGLKAYYKYHHTAPDRSTIKRTERLFAQYF